MTTELARALETIMDPGFGKDSRLARNRAPEPAGDPVKALIRAIAMDIGKQVVHHIETMYPQAIEACAKTSFKLSVRNCVHNEIVAAIEVSDEGQIIARLKERKEHRRKIGAAWRKIRTPRGV